MQEIIRSQLVNILVLSYIWNVKYYGLPKGSIGHKNSSFTFFRMRDNRRVEHKCFGKIQENPEFLLWTVLADVPLSFIYVFIFVLYSTCIFFYFYMLCMFIIMSTYAMIAKICWILMSLQSYNFKPGLWFVVLCYSFKALWVPVVLLRWTFSLLCTICLSDRREIHIASYKSTWTKNKNITLHVVL